MVSDAPLPPIFVAPRQTPGDPAAAAVVAAVVVVVAAVVVRTIAVSVADGVVVAVAVGVVFSVAAVRLRRGHPTFPLTKRRLNRGLRSETKLVSMKGDDEKRNEGRKPKGNP